MEDAPDRVTDVVVIEDERGRREVDLAPVRIHLAEMERGFRGEIPLMGNVDAGAAHERLSKMNEEQLRYLVMDLEARLRSAVRRTRWLYTTAGQKHVRDTRDFAAKADESGIVLWEDNNELRE